MIYTNADRLNTLFWVFVMFVEFCAIWRFTAYCFDIEHRALYPTFKERRARRAGERRYRRYIRNRDAYLKEHHYAD